MAATIGGQGTANCASRFQPQQYKSPSFVNAALCQFPQAIYIGGKRNKFSTKALFLIKICNGKVKDCPCENIGKVLLVIQKLEVVKNKWIKKKYLEQSLKRKAFL